MHERGAGCRPSAAPRNDFFPIVSSPVRRRKGLEADVAVKLSRGCCRSPPCDGTRCSVPHHRSRSIDASGPPSVMSTSYPLPGGHLARGPGPGRSRRPEELALAGHTVDGYSDRAYPGPASRKFRRWVETRKRRPRMGFLLFGTRKVRAPLETEASSQKLEEERIDRCGRFRGLSRRQDPNPSPTRISALRCNNFREDQEDDSAPRINLQGTQWH
jgi:hypothetical protein